MVKKFVQIPLVATCHPWLESSIRTKFYAWLDKNLLKKFDQITAISNIEKNEIRQRVAAHKISVINNGVDISRFAKIYNIKKIKAELGIKSDGKVVGTVGRLSPEKGHENLFKAIIRIAPNNGDLTLVVVGDGPLKKKLQAQANKFKIVDHIIFTGISNEIPSLMSIFDVFVLPSQTEGLPMALLEAMAAKKPVVATDVGDVSSVIQNQVSGLLIPPNNSEKMAEAINRLLSDKKLADNLAQKGFEMAKKKYSSSNMAEQYVNVFDRVRPT
jgi:glycosyltransferase involved in cell wall biosynthesis